jgi:hypothetical protein
MKYKLLSLFFLGVEHFLAFDGGGTKSRADAKHWLNPQTIQSCDDDNIFLFNRSGKATSVLILSIDLGSVLTNGNARLARWELRRGFILG